MTDFMFEVMELLEQGNTVVAKQGEKAEPKELAIAVLQYCEGAGYTINDVFEVGNEIAASARHIMWDMVAEKRLYKSEDDVAFMRKRPTKTKQGAEIKGITIDLSTHGTRQAIKENK